MPLVTRWVCQCLPPGVPKPAAAPDGLGNDFCLGPRGITVMISRNLTVLLVVLLVFFPVISAIVAFSRKRKVWGWGILLSILTGYGWLVSILFFREILKGKGAFKRIFALVGGMGGALIGLRGILRFWPKMVGVASQISLGPPVLVNGSLFTCSFIFVSSLSMLALGLFVWCYRLLHFGVTGWPVRFRTRFSSLRLSVPSYFCAGRDWVACIAGAPMVDIMVLNPNSGFVGSVDPLYAAHVAQAQERGIRVIGYVCTQYGGRDIVSVKREIHQYIRGYGVNGILLDQASTQGEDIHYYDELARAVRALPGSLVVLGHGTFPDERYARVGDVLCVFVGNQAEQLACQPPVWVYDYPPEQFWHIVYAVPTARKMKLSLLAAERLHAGRIYVTDGKPPNPFAQLPTYWNEELARVSS